MALRLFNTMGRTMQEFVPIHENHVGFYGCGPTVYNYAHIGNLRAYVFLDILDKTLKFLGYDIKHVMNITDVGHLTGDGDDGDDKMLKTAEERHQSVLEVAKYYTDAFMKDIDALNIRHPDVICKATEHITEMIELIKKLEANGHTYMAGGNLYYDISTYPDYGKLANLDLEKLVAGKGKRNVVVVDENKRNPGDFVLWFTKSKFENQAMTWDSPWGRGYPGWHIECSAMSMKYLGKHFDIHTGGIDHVPVHHTNEIAQSEGSFSEEERKEGPWVKYWLHNEFLILEGGKMSKSKGHFITLQTELPAEKGYSLTSKGFAPLDYRFFLLGGHYRKPLVFSLDGMESAKNGRAALNERVTNLVAKAKVEEKIELTAENFSEILGRIASHIEESENLKLFKQGLENDLATPVALSALQKASNGKNQKASEALADIFTMDKVISLSLIENAIANYYKLENTIITDIANQIKTSNTQRQWKNADVSFEELKENLYKNQLKESVNISNKKSQGYNVFFNLIEKKEFFRALKTLEVLASGRYGTPAATSITEIFEMQDTLNIDFISRAFRIIDRINTDDHAGDPEAAEITALVAERTAAKKAKDFAKADQIRNDLATRGITIIDTPQGPTWKRG